MPLNLLKIYNDRLELFHQSERDNLRSIRAVFDRDLTGEPILELQGIPIKPTTADGEDTMDRLFRHLTTVVTDKDIKKREFERERSVRIHWVKHHVINMSNQLVFSVIDEKRVYVLDRAERYIIVFEPLRKERAFFLLTAYPLLPATYKAVMTKFEKRGKLGIL